jgi:hypothetical protein
MARLAASLEPVESGPLSLAPQHTVMPVAGPAPVASGR